MKKVVSKFSSFWGTMGRSSCFFFFNFKLH